MDGKDLRLRRLFKSERLLLVPMDHGVTLGAVGGLGDIRGAVRAVAAGGADGVVVHKGIARQIMPELTASNRCELVVHLSASTSLAPDPNRKELVGSVERAVRLGAAGVSVHVNLASQSEARMLRDLGLVAEDCAAWGMPLLAMMYVRDGSRASEYDPEKLAHAARVAEELGADIVKVNYTGDPESFARVVEAVRLPVIIAGGPKSSRTEALLAAIRGALQAGARGVAIGRNLFEDADPRALTASIRRILDGQEGEPRGGD